MGFCLVFDINEIKDELARILNVKRLKTHSALQVVSCKLKILLLEIMELCFQFFRAAISIVKLSHEDADVLIRR